MDQAEKPSKEARRLPDRLAILEFSVKANASNEEFFQCGKPDAHTFSIT